MRFLKLILFLTILFPVAAFGHGYWLETEGNNQLNEQVIVKLFYGDYAAGERLSGKTLDKMKDIKVSVITPGGEKKEIAMTQLEGCWEGSFTPDKEGTYEITGINDTRDVQDWTAHKLGIVRPIQYLRMDYVAGKKPGKVRSPLFIDVHVKKLKKDEYELTVLKNNVAVPSQEVIVAGFDNGEEPYMTDKNGKAVIEIKKPGIYIISIDWIDKTPGEFKQKAYETVRHRLDFSLQGDKHYHSAYF